MMRATDVAVRDLGRNAVDTADAFEALNEKREALPDLTDAEKALLAILEAGNDRHRGGSEYGMTILKEHDPKTGLGGEGAIDVEDLLRRFYNNAKYEREMGSTDATKEIELNRSLDRLEILIRRFGSGELLKGLDLNGIRSGAIDPYATGGRRSARRIPVRSSSGSASGSFGLGLGLLDAVGGL